MVNLSVVWLNILFRSVTKGDMLTQSYKRYNRKCLPTFSLASYAKLLKQLTAAGYQFRKIRNMEKTAPGRFAYIRHDIDFHLFNVDKMAKLEASLGIAATYYVLLTQYYNPMNRDNKSILRTIRDLGHELGLHYDLENYPDEPMEARAHLDWEANILSKIADAPIRTIATHLPYRKQPDPFITIDDYVHPHDPRYQEGLVYVSDSCRAWRDESLLNCFGHNPPNSLLLTIHPELWLDGSINDRITYLDRVLIKNAQHQYRGFFDNLVRQVWLTHPATVLHEKRERESLGCRSTPPKISDLPGD